MKDRLSILNKLNINIKQIIDIGAHHGEWYELAKSIFPNANILSFEANPKCKNILEQKGIPHDICFLSNKQDEIINFYQCNHDCDTGNSIFKELTTQFDSNNYTLIELKTHTLDNKLETFNINKVDLLKLDVQGAELLILEGATNILQNTEFVILEVSLFRYNQEAPLFSDVIKFMDSNGFHVFDILELHPYDVLHLQCDILFINKNSEYTTSIANIISNRTPWKVSDLYK